MERVRGLLEKLSSLEGCEKSINWLKEQVGEGADFSVLVSGIFLGTKEPLEVLFKEIGKLPTATRGGVSAVLLQKIIESDDPAGKIQSAFSSADPESLKEGMGVALQLYFMQSDSVADSMNSMRSIMSSLDGESLAGFRNAYLGGLSRVAPKDAWREMRSLAKESVDSESWQPDLRNRISAQLRALGARDSLEFLIQEGGTATELEKSVSMWGNMNSVELNKWISNQMNNLSPSQQDGVRSGLAIMSLDQRDFPALREHLESISDLDVRSDIERRLWEGQREAIQEDITKDPTGTMEAMISGSKGAGDEWIEVAMNAWISKDPAQAEEWYQSNWKSLPTQKSQYIAAAYAKEALKQGDVAGARQWTAYIEDAKTKQRIEAGIAEADARKEIEQQH